MKYIDKDSIVNWLSKDEKYSELLEEINRGTFDSKNYQKLSQEFVGKELNDGFCNGFFGTTYDLNGARVLKVWEEDEHTIKIEVKKRNGEVDYGYFDDGWNNWKTVYQYLGEWVMK